MVMPEPPRPFGAKIRPHDPAQDAYRYPARAKAANWSQPVGIPKDLRAPIWDQMAQGSCSASVLEAIESAAHYQGRSVVDLSHKQNYWDSRVAQNFFGLGVGADTGAYLADAAGAALNGVARELLWPYNANSFESPPAGLDADRPRQDWLAAHRAIYPGPGASDQVYDALARGCTITIGWYVRGDMYSPGGKPYPRGLTPDPQGQHGTHASYLCAAFMDQGEVWGVVPQSWGEGCNAGIATYNETFRKHCRDGEVVIPLLDWCDRRDSPLWELRVIDLDPFVRPEPDPQPQPDGFAAARGLSAQLARTKAAAMYQMERDYYAQGLRYEGDQCWFSALQLEALAGEIDTLREAPALRPRGQGAA